MGRSFPLASRLFIRDATKLGARVGDAYLHAFPIRSRPRETDAVTEAN